MMLKKLIMAMVCMVMAAVAAVAEDEMRSVTVYDGLAGETVYKIFKSRWNVMWMATNDGVSSFNGARVKAYRVSEKRSDNNINEIAQAEDGFIWVGTNKGVYRVNGSKEYLERVLPQINTMTFSIKIQGKNVYIGTSDGLFIGNTEKPNDKPKHVWLNKSHVSDNNKVIDSYMEYQKGKLTGLLLLSNKELYRYDMQKDMMTAYGLRNKLSHGNISMRNMTVSGNRVFIGTFNDGLMAYDLKTGKLEKYKDVGCNVITCLSTDKDYLYVGTDGAGLHVISLKDNTTREIYSTRADSRYRLKDNTVYSFYRNEQGVNFFGYYRQGMHYNYYRHSLFKPYVTTLFDSRGVNVRSFCITDSIKVIGLRGGIYLLDERNNKTKFFTPEELGGSIVTNIAEYKGLFYCCTFNGGVMRIDPNAMTASRFGKSEALRTGSFSDLKVSPDGELWMSGNAGLYIYNADNDTERHFDNNNSQLPDVYCNGLLFDRLGRCWISTLNNLCLYDPIDNKIHAYDFPKGFFNDITKAKGIMGNGDKLVFYCPDGLFATNEEMTEFGQKFANMTVLQDNISQAIYDHRRRNYWIATEMGLYRFDSKMEHMQKFASESGLASNEFSNGALYIDYDHNRLWTGTMNGLYYADLNKAQTYDNGNADIVMDDITIDGKKANDEQSVSLLRNKSIRLAFNWTTERLSVMPLLLNYCKQDGLCFEYRIGNQGPWTVLRNNHKIEIDNLPLGQTLLQIRLAGSDNNTIVYRLYSIPSAWFLAQIIIILCVILASVVLYKQRITVKRQRMEMAKVQKELQETKRKYGRINTSELEMQRLFDKLEDYMKKDKPYLDSDLKLSDIASHLECSTVKLSQLFSTFVKKNYYDYVNLYRLNEFKRRQALAQYKNYTLLALAEECGFRRSSFFSTFKKVEGVTPTEYVKNGDKNSK